MVHFSKIKFVALLVLSVSFLASADQNLKIDQIKGKIFGGKNAEPGKWPFYSFLAVKSFLSPSAIISCGSVIIGKKWVVSATHCTFGSPAKNIYAYAGYPTSEFLNYEQNSVARAKYEYPNYDGRTVRNDIVLVELKKNLVFNELVQAIKLPENNERVPDGSECAIIGYGKTEEDISRKERMLKVGLINVISQRQCSSIYGNIIRESNICANDPTASVGACKGDSGGPLVCFDEDKNEYVLRGVTSFGSPNCGDKNTPEVWTRITWYLGWIKELMTECDFPAELPVNSYTLSTQTKFKVGEVLSVFCKPGFMQSGTAQVECRKNGFFDEIDTRCVEQGFYGDWKIGTCSVTCATGTRMDARECVAGLCGEPLVRVSACRLRPCPEGDDVCASLSCSNNAVCEKNGKVYECKCLPGFVGDGFSCAIEELGILRSKLKIGL